MPGEEDLNKTDLNMTAETKKTEPSTAPTTQAQTTQPSSPQITTSSGLFKIVNRIFFEIFLMFCFLIYSRF